MSSFAFFASTEFSTTNMPSHGFWYCSLSWMFQYFLPRGTRLLIDIQFGCAKTWYALCTLRLSTLGEKIIPPHVFALIGSRPVTLNSHGISVTGIASFPMMHSHGTFIASRLSNSFLKKYIKWMYYVLLFIEPLQVNINYIVFSCTVKRNVAHARPHVCSP